MMAAAAEATSELLQDQLRIADARSECSSWRSKTSAASRYEEPEGWKEPRRRLPPIHTDVEINWSPTPYDRGDPEANFLLMALKAVEEYNKRKGTRLELKKIVRARYNFTGLLGCDFTLTTADKDKDVWIKAVVAMEIYGKRPKFITNRLLVIDCP